MCLFCLSQSDENDPDQPSDSEGSTKGEPQVNVTPPTVHLQTQWDWLKESFFIIYKDTWISMERMVRNQ